ncbi:hypothetical protein DFR50_10767 [Roseiarcus fermentans]|uniref:Uncharacterized protein n=1 Tax=Roseiarcus fermentans TaxID=1473586 RepID=A0A366FMG0_9HYPH|nr:hypothetical protein [Roseiarcus fermentans]RBP15797.1 hypothetical protein DFR50_10767 [Roseiarcus fermentans]
MRQRVEPSSIGAIASIAALLGLLAANPAQAGGLAPDPDAGVGAAECGAPGQSCARIRGYIKAGSEFPERSVQKPVRYIQPPLLAGVGDIGRAASDALNRGIGFLKTSGENAAR